MTLVDEPPPASGTTAASATDGTDESSETVVDASAFAVLAGVAVGASISMGGAKYTWVGVSTVR